MLIIHLFVILELQVIVIFAVVFIFGIDVKAATFGRNEPAPSAKSSSDSSRSMLSGLPAVCKEEENE